MSDSITRKVIGNWEDKIWGKTRTVVDSKYYSEHELEIDEGGYCSLHYHLRRANQFQILDGKVEILEVYGLVDVKRTVLGPGNIYNVPSLIPHMFTVHSTGHMIECYYPDRGGDVMVSDIIRIIEGGKMEVDQLQFLPQSIIQKAGISW